MQRGELAVKLMGRGIAWLDTGTNRSLMEASQFIESIEERQGLKIACLEEIAWRNRWISTEQLVLEADSMGKSTYSTYLHKLAKEQT